MTTATAINPTSKDILYKLIEQGIESDTHHATVKSTFKDVTGEKLGKDGYRDVKEALAALEEEIEAAEAPDPKALLKQAEKIVRERAGDPDMEGWENVVEVTEVSPKGKPVRVIVECQDPLETRDGESVCVETREIQAQDVFQVRRCEPCQSRHLQLIRNRLARERRRRQKKEQGDS